MNLNVLKFVHLRFSTLVLNQLFVYKERFKQTKILKLNSKLPFYSTFALVWTLKKSVASASEIEKKTVIDNADNLFENGHYQQCYKVLDGYQAAADVEIQWRLCRLLYNMSKELEGNEHERKELIYKAYSIISKQLENHWDNYAVHKWYALLLDAKSTNEGIKERINQLQNVKKHMDLAVTLNPSDATTLHMLGEWCYQVTEMPWYQRKIAQTLFGNPPYSNYEDALEYFLRAESAQPRFYSLNLLRIGNCYLKLNRDDQAKYYLKLAASYPAKSNDDHQANKQAAELLKKMK